MTIGAGLHPVMLPIHLTSILPGASPVFADTGDFREEQVPLSGQVTAAEELPLNMTTSEFHAQELIRVDNADLDVRVSYPGLYGHSTYFGS